MKKRKLILMLLPMFLLAACQTAQEQSPGNSNPNNPTITNPDDDTGEGTSTDNDNTGTDDNTDTNTDNTGTDDDTGENDEFVPKTLEEVGYKQMELPKNHGNPIEIETSYNNDTHWWENEMYDEWPSSFRGIYGNNEWTSANPFYSYNPSDEKQYPGGLKLSKESQGFQSAEFTVTGKKLEIRIGISQVNNASGPTAKTKPTAYLYYFNNKGQVLGYDTIEKETITTNTAGKYVRFYVTASYVSEIAYTEFRLVAFPYVSSQNYNIGIGYFNICSCAYGA